jgi:hypothetical protein
MSASRRAILILGMHRSGTSALTRVLNLRGAALPAAVLPANDANVAGYWEPAAIVSLHDRLLADAGSAWDDPTEFPDAWFDSARGREYVDELVRTIDAEYGSETLLVVKDPRACRLVALWRRALDTIGVVPGAVLTVRHPLEVAASLAKRDGVPETHALLLWLEHVLAAEAGSRSMPRVTVTYEQVLTDWSRCCDRIEAALGLELPPRSPAGDQAIEAFLEPSLRHAAIAPDALSRPGIPEWIPRVYGSFEAASRGEPIDLAALDTVREDLRQAGALFTTSVRWLAHRAWTGANLAFEAEAHRRTAEAGRDEAVHAQQALGGRVGELEGMLAAEQARSADVAREAAESAKRAADLAREAADARQSADHCRRRLDALEATWAVRLQKKLSGS